MKIQHKLKRLIEQPSLPMDLIKGIKPRLKRSCLIVKDLSKEDIRTFIDVGANTGEFSNAIQNVFNNVNIIAFEPLKECERYLQDYHIDSIFMFGLWDKDEKKTLSVNKNRLDESSFLIPKGYEGEKRIVYLRRFDSLNVHIMKPCFLKIDVEGAELKVLKGFGSRLNDIDFLQVEVLFEKMYKNQSKIKDIISYLYDYNFNGFIQTGVTYTEEGYPSKCDLIFFKNG